MAKHAVGTGRQQGTASLLELADGVVEGDNFGRADEREVEGVKVKTDPATGVIGEPDGAELLVGVVLGAVVSIALEVRGLAAIFRLMGSSTEKAADERRDRPDGEGEL